MEGYLVGKYLTLNNCSNKMSYAGDVEDPIVFLTMENIFSFFFTN